MRHWFEPPERPRLAMGPEPRGKNAWKWKTVDPWLRALRVLGCVPLRGSAPTWWWPRAARLARPRERRRQLLGRGVYAGAGVPGSLQGLEQGREAVGWVRFNHCSLSCAPGPRR